MKDEIKEILEEIDNKIIPKEHWNKIKDYITNLQEENEILKEILHWKQIENNIFYKSRIDKAIELINYFGITPDENDDLVCRGILKDLLNILQGSDK